MSGIRDLNLGRVWRVWGIRGLVVLLAMILLAGMALVPPTVTSAQDQETACPDCGGKGKIPCLKCDGTGVLKCPECGGDGKVLCSMPGGWGVYCGGTGICSACKGDGIFSGVKCPGCGGTGVCQQCNGTGQTRCISCNGKGQRACPNCVGGGQVLCTRCSGTGKIQTEEDETQPAEEEASGWGKITSAEEETSTEEEVAAWEKETSEGPVLTVISGEVEVQKGGAGEWTEYDQTGLKSGDEFRTGENSKAVIETTDGDSITVGPKTYVTIVDMDRYIDLRLGEIICKIKGTLTKWKCKFEVRTPSACCCVRGTEFTVSVDEDGTTTVMVLDGFVEVQDLTSNAGITLPANQMVTVPKGGLTQEEMLEKAELVWPDKVDRWWEEAPAATGEQPAPASSGIKVTDIVAVAAIIIVVALVFAPLLRRRHSKSPG